MRTSISTIDAPEFINIVPYNPLISQCEIKVFYVGENRNRSFISKEVAAEMANSLPGTPICGFYKADKQDFSDHGQVVTIDDEGVKFEVRTKPYGFVAPDAKVWFKKFDDQDEFGNMVQREYLMTTGYLWTGQYEEAQRVIRDGNPQSMELDEKTLDGKWATNNNTGVEFFIINDAIFSKIAILGTDVEPCFEGAAITAPQVSATFTLDEAFKTTLFAMMQDLRKAIETTEGGLNMTKQELIDSGKMLSEFTEEERGLFSAEEIKDFEDAEVVETVEYAVATPNAGEVRDAFISRCMKAGDNMAACSASWDKGAGEPDEGETPPTKSALEAEEEISPAVVEETEDQPDTNLAELQIEFDKLREEVVALREFKVATEDTQKDTLIQGFYMLSDEDKEDVIKNKSEYSLDDIEAKLAVICVRKKVNFDQDLENNDTCDDAEDAPIVTFNLDDAAGDDAPAFVRVLREAQKKND